MKISKISAVVFSPTDLTMDIVLTLGNALPKMISPLNVTGRASKARKFASDEFVIFGVPVYGGRVPTTAADRLREMEGDNTPAVIVVTYGNRHYDDALLELSEIVSGQGFVPIAAGAFVAEHSIMHSVAQGRPDQQDKDIICQFAKDIWDKVESDNAMTPVKVPGNKPFREYGGVPFKPFTTEDCGECGVCVNHCPTGAIPVDEPSKTDAALCISCMRCIKVCPVHSRKLDEKMLAGAEKAFAQQCKDRKEPETFL